MEHTWLLFCPQLPATPSSPRVMVWRRMHTAGAVGLDNGLWILPCNEASQKIVQEMQAYVQGQGGASRIFLATAFDEVTEAGIVKRFRQDRAEEYYELQEQCQDFLAEIDKEIGRQNYSFAEYEENAQDLEKLEAWFGKVKQRDFLGGDQAQEAEGWLDACRQALQRFEAEVIAHEKADPLGKDLP